MQANAEVRPLDVNIAGPEAKPDYGTHATFESRGAKGDLDKRVLAQKFASLFEEVNRYRMQPNGEWINLYRQYNGLTQRDDKEPWQSTINVPLAIRAVDTFAARITASMFADPDFFEVDPERDKDELLVELAKKAILWQLRKGKALGPIKDAVKDALICGNGFLKIYFREDMTPITKVVAKPLKPVRVLGLEIPVPGSKYEFEDSTKLTRQIKFEAVVPTNIWLDPHGRFLIQRVTRDISDVWALARDEKGPDGEIVRPAVYDAEEVAKVKAGSYDPKMVLDEAAIRRDLGDPMHQSQGRQIDIYEFWGDFPDPDTGAILYRNILATFADKRYTFRMPQRNPLRHAKIPFIHFRAKNAPHQVYGTGILAHNAKIQDEVNRLWNVILDKAHLQVPTLEYDPQAAKDPTELMGGRPNWKPGKMWAKKPGETRRIFYPVEGFPPVTEWDILLNDRLQVLYDLTSGMSEFVTGGQQSSNRKTKFEVAERTGASEQVFNDAAVFMEENAIGPLVQMVYETMLQYEEEFDSPSLTKMFGDDTRALAFLEQLTLLSPEERWLEMHMDTEFRAVGISNQIERERKLRDLMEFNRMTAADPMMRVIIDQPELLRMTLQLLRMPKRLVLEQASAILQAQQQAMIAQIFGPQAAGQMGGAPGMPPQNPHNQMAQLAGEAGSGGPPEQMPQ